MSAALALPVVLESTAAVADPEFPVARPRPLGGLAFYRRHTVALLRRYLVTSMVIGRAPCVLGNVAFRGRLTSYRMQSFEDQIIFVFDVEKCLKRLDRVSQEVVAHIVLEDYSPLEAANLMGESQRSVERVYTEALDRLTRFFLETQLLRPDAENLSRGATENESNK
ncbi:MAG: hypothetical protein WCA44_04190 [Acidobacteriaceae bacterium]